MSDPVIRRATLQDAEALSRIGRESFVETFGHLYPAEDLAEFLGQAYGLERARKDLADPAKASWIVEAEGEVVGYALSGPSELPHPDVAAGDGELKRLYVLKALQGGGTGSRLFAQALDWLEARGAKRIWIGVWSQNHGAQRLYSRAGFKKVGEYEFPVGRVRDREFILARTAQPQ